MIKIKSYSGITVLESEQVINADIREVWDFFSYPLNLGKITPPEMRFTITGTDTGRSTYPGQIITYSLNPFRGLRVNRVTEITHMEKYRSFTDEQRFGPYKFWHHRHLFSREGEKTIMNDIVTFMMPGWLIGKIAGTLLIVPRIKRIFEYRRERIDEMFSSRATR